MTTAAIVAVVILAALVLRAGAASVGAGPLPNGAAPAFPESSWGQWAGNPYSIVDPCWEVYNAARAAGFDEDGARTITAIAQAESGCDPQATCDSCLGVREYSVGVFQLNLLAHPQIPEIEARDIYSAARWAFQISAGGVNFRPWSTYTSGAYRRHLAAA